MLLISSDKKFKRTAAGIEFGVSGGAFFTLGYDINFSLEITIANETDSSKNENNPAVPTRKK